MAKSNNRTEQEIQEARRRRKLERQEKRVERLNEPLLVWLHKSFRVVTIAGTVVMAGLEVRNSMMVGAENMMQRVLFTALGAWLVFGLVWAGSAIGQMIVLHLSLIHIFLCARSGWSAAAGAVRWICAVPAHTL